MVQTKQMHDIFLKACQIGFSEIVKALNIQLSRQLPSVPQDRLFVLSGQLLQHHNPVISWAHGWGLSKKYRVAHLKWPYHLATYDLPILVSVCDQSATSADPWLAYAADSAFPMFYFLPLKIDLSWLCSQTETRPNITV